MSLPSRSVNRLLLSSQRLVVTFAPRRAASLTPAAVHGSLDSAPSITMGKKKNAKKLKAQQTVAAAGGQPNQQMTKTQARTPSEVAQNNVQQGQGKKAKRQRKRTAKQQRLQQQLEEEHTQESHGARQPPVFASATEDPAAYFAPGHGSRGGRGEDLSGQGSFVGQPLFEALDSVEKSGGKVEPVNALSGTGRRTSLAWRPATSDGANDSFSSGAHIRSDSRSQVQPQPPGGGVLLPQNWQVSGRADMPLPNTASCQAPASSAAPNGPATEDNPYGYNIKNATWDWNTFSGSVKTSESSAGPRDTSDGNDSGSSTSVLNRQAGTTSAFWPSAYGLMAGYGQQAYMAPYGQAFGWNHYQQTGFLPQSGYYPNYQGLNGPRHFHGHANSFTPGFPTVASNRGLATNAAGNGGLISPERTSESEGGGKVNGRSSRRSKRLAAKELAEDQVARAWDGIQAGSQQILSQSPTKPRSPPPSPSRKKGPPQPQPTEEYIRQASAVPKQLDTPQTLLVIIDLNGTLVHRPSRKNSSRVVCRPYVQAFLDYLLANHRVMVWSSARPENVGKMCAQLFEPHRRAQLMAEWGRDTLGLTPAQYQEKVQVYKILRKVWLAAAVGEWHPAHRAGQRFGQHNTFLVDDSMLKASSEPHNLVQVEEFEGRPEQMQSDVLRQVVGYLEQARRVSDVSAWVKGGERFAFGRGWDYVWPEGTRADALPPGLSNRDTPPAQQQWWRESLRTKA